MDKKKRDFLVQASLSVAAGGVAGAAMSGGDNAQQERPPVLERVLNSGILRVGYFSWYPAVLKNPIDGTLSGIFHDYTNELGKALSLKVEWAEEVGLGEYPAALESERIDVMSGGVYITSERARAVDFCMPAYYLPLYLYARTDDTRFDRINAEGDDFLNDSQYTFAILEGGVTSTLRRNMFPKANANELPQLTSPAELFVTLQLGKADVLIYDPFTYQDYNDKNPGKIRQVSQRPLKVFPNALAVKRGEYDFRQMLVHATMELHLNGRMDEIVKKHEKYAGTIIRVPSFV